MVAAPRLADRRPAAREFQKRLTWDSVKLIQDELAGVPLITKGIMRPEDAVDGRAEVIITAGSRAAPTWSRRSRSARAPC